MSSSSNAIEVEHLGKRYLLGEQFGFGSLRDALVSRVAAAPRVRRPEIWALRDVTFEVGVGEVLGVIGRNGAGKTTLLKILSRITEPTEGRARVRGRVGALLEVGTGFHPELTGRENVFLNGAILGMTRREIGARFDEIVAFAGVERFLDTPLKRYSAGMYLRLAFSVAAHLEPEIVVVDEVLAVGDADFQRKCLGQMSELHRSGRTVVFVSHDLGAVGQLCERAIWLDRGVVKDDGPTHRVLDNYLKSSIPEQARVDFPDDPSRRAQLVSVQLIDEGGEPVEIARRDEPLVVCMRFRLREMIVGLDLAIYVVSREGARVLDEDWSDTRGASDPVLAPGEYEATATLPPLFAPGEYVLGVWMGTRDEDFANNEILSFQLAPRPDDRQAALERTRLIALGLEWSVQRRTPVAPPPP
jgi:ABC-type polysaccharide/polyol phosphate transport system ATPase subunit